MAVSLVSASQKTECLEWKKNPPAGAEAAALFSGRVDSLSLVRTGSGTFPSKTEAVNTFGTQSKKCPDFALRPDLEM